jgi:hypothetical protein
MMFEVGDKVKYVGTTSHPEYQNLGVGVVLCVGDAVRAFPVSVVFEGFYYDPTGMDYLTPFHPCGLDELEKV